MDFIGTETTIARDLQINLERLVKDSALGEDHALLITLAIAKATDFERMRAWAESQLGERGFTPEQIREAGEVSAIMGMLNIYYRFRHFMADSTDYPSAGLRMTALARPLLGQERFELIAFAVSVLNGCEKCVISHEAALKKLGVTADQIHDAARLAAVVKGASHLSGG